MYFQDTSSKRGVGERRRVAKTSIVTICRPEIVIIRIPRTPGTVSMPYKKKSDDKN